MSMEVSNTYGNYGADYNTNAAAQKTEKSNTKAETTKKASHRNVKEYGDYLRNKYKCLTPTKTTSVTIAPNLMRKAMTDEKTAKWLEYNLSIMPEADEKIRATVEASGGKLLSCHTTIDAYGSMTCNVMARMEADPGTDKIRERTEETIKRRREERKAEEKKQAERQEKERLEELAEENEDESAVTITGTDIQAITSRLVTSIRGDVSVSSFDVRA